MNTKTKVALTRWLLGAAPEAPKDSDNQRFYYFVCECLIAETNIDSDDLADLARKNLKWDENSIIEFSSEPDISIQKNNGFIEFLME
mgnify:CR=1 FL=1